MSILHIITDESRPHRKRKRVGRGIGSGKGKTSCRGHKGQGSRRGSKSRSGYEGGQVRLFMKLPSRGFTRGRFLQPLDSINLYQIDAVFNDGETVNAQTLRQHGFIKGHSYGVKILGDGELTKALKFEVDTISQSAQEKIQKAKGQVNLIRKN